MSRRVVIGLVKNHPAFHLVVYRIRLRIRQAHLFAGSPQRVGADQIGARRLALGGHEGLVEVPQDIVDILQANR